jgi:LuxR family transcriptional regulator, maltose regulon positive regulatory protein
MPTPLLATKLYLPTPRPDVVSRPRLLRRLDEGYASGCRLTLISAPAGFGKTTLLSEWIQRFGSRAAWLALDEGDNDPVRFWRYVVGALQRVEPEVGMALQPLLQSNTPVAADVIVTALLNDLASLSSPMILALEDYHLVSSDEIHGGLNFFLNHPPARVHLVITTRSDPPLQLSRHRARREVVEIRTADLRFEYQEVVGLLNAAMHLGLSDPDVRALEARTEGWAAGLQMAALTLQSRSDRHGFVEAFMGDDRYIADYLVEEVLQRLSPDVQSFLLQTSVLARLSAPLCDAVTGRSDSQAILDELERSNLFILPLDNRREWFRYHRLFAELLRRNLARTQGAAAVRELQVKASRYFESIGNFPEAVEYILASGSLENSVMLILLSAEVMFGRNELITLLTWADRLPEAFLVKQPTLLLMFAWAAHATGNNQRAGEYLEMVDRLAGVHLDASQIDPEDPSLSEIGRAALVEVSVLRASIALDHLDSAHTLAIGQVVLPYTTPEQADRPHLFNPPLSLHSPLLFTMGLGYQFEGDLDAAARHFSAAAEQARLVRNIHIIALSTGHLGEVLVLQGRLEEARAVFEQALRLDEEFGKGQSAFFGLSYVGLGNLALEWDELDQAREYLDSGIELGRLWKLWECLLPGYLGLARLESGLGNWGAASDALDALEHLASHAPGVVRPAIESGRARLNLLQGQRAQAGQWAEAHHAMIDGTVSSAHEEEAVVLARILLAQGKLEDADRLSTRLARQAISGERWGRAIPALLVQACAEAALGQHAAAGSAILRALGLAEPGHYRRIFLEGGVPVRALLEARRAIILEEANDIPAPRLLAYIQTLLAAFDSAQPAAPAPVVIARTLPVQAGLAEPLSERELEVLRLMATGASNAEIAQKYYITVNTVKKHISNIFGKLEATTRIQAVERARKLGLIS